MAKTRKQKPPKGCVPIAPKRGIRQSGRFSQGFAYVSQSGAIVNKVETFKLVRELVPLGESAKTFAGYPTLFHALAVAGSTAKIGVVLQASRDPTINLRDNPYWFGRFHVFETDSEPKELPSGVIVEASELPRGILSAHVTNLVKPLDTRPWKERVAAVKAATTNIDRYRLARRLLEDFVLLSTTVNVYSDPEVENRSLGIMGRKALFQGNAVNIEYSGDLAQSQPNAYADVANVDDVKDETTEKFCKKDTDDLPSTFIAVTRYGFEGKNVPFFMAATLAHEAVHIHHWHRGVFLLERWRKLKRPDEFHLWADKTVGGYDAQLVFNLCQRMAGSSLTHLEPHVEGWILSVTYLPLAELKFDAKAAIYPAITDFISIQEKYFVSTGYGVDCVKAFLRDRLVKTFENLPSERQTIVRESMDTKIRQVHSSKARNKDFSFYRWLHEIWGLKFPDLPT